MTDSIYSKKDLAHRQMIINTVMKTAGIFSVKLVDNKKCIIFDVSFDDKKFTLRFYTKVGGSAKLRFAKPKGIIDSIVVFENYRFEIAKKGYESLEEIETVIQEVLQTTLEKIELLKEEAAQLKANEQNRPK